MRNSNLLLAVGALILSACQSTGEQAALSPATPQTTAQAAATATPTSSAPSATAAASATAFAQTPAQTPAQCAIQLAGGPPPKPNKGADFAQNAVGKNLARNAGRNILANIGGRVAGPIGGAVSGSLAAQAIRTEQDLHGKWMMTDGTSNCACEVDISTSTGLVPDGYFRSSGYRLKDAMGGKVKNISCSNPNIAATTSFALGYSFTGYDAELALQAANGSGVGLLKRDGLNYFSGTLSDGTPVTMWRR